MKGEILFEKMTGISDEFVKEAALVAPVTAESGQKRRTAPWRRGLSAACIVLVAVVALLLGTATAGRIATPAPEGTPPLARFGFAYELGGFDGTAMPGDTVSVNTTIINRGLPFVYHGSSAGYHPDACFVLQDDESVSMQCAFMETCDSGPHAVTMGMEGGGYGEITIPADAVPGVYDLVLSYKGMTQVYKGVLTVGEVETEGETYPPISTDHAFSFGYEAADAVVQPGDRTSISCWTVNDGAAFTYTGYPDKYAPTAYLLHRESTYVIRGTTAPIEYDGQETITIMTGEIAGKVSYVFPIPADAPTGEYELVLSCLRNKQSFEGVLTVGEVDTEGETQPPKDTTDSPFSFGYEPFGGFAIPGDFVRIEAWVINDGEPFTYIGNSYKETGRFYPTVTLYHQETGYTIKVLPPETAIEPILYTVETGEKGKNTYARMIPTDAPTGEYGLVLSYGGYECRFDSILTVAVP